MGGCWFAAAFFLFFFVFLRRGGGRADLLPSFGTARKKAFWKGGLLGASDHLRIVGLGGHIGSLVDELLLLVYNYRIIARFCFGEGEIDSDTQHAWP